MGSAINQDALMTTHETTPSDAAIGQAWRELKGLATNHISAPELVSYVSARAREIEQGRGAVEVVPSLFDKFSNDHIAKMLSEWAADQRERSEWNDNDKTTYNYCARLLQTAANRICRMGNRDE